MMELYAQFEADMQAGPAWVVVWTDILAAILLASIVFAFFRREALVIFIAGALGAAATLAIYSQVGYVRLLGLGHTLFWTPAVIWLWMRRSSWRVAETWSGKYIALAFTVMVISLAFDITDVGRWILGERG